MLIELLFVRHADADFPAVAADAASRQPPGQPVALLCRRKVGRCPPFFMSIRLMLFHGIFDYYGDMHDIDISASISSPYDGLMRFGARASA